MKLTPLLAALATLNAVLFAGVPDPKPEKPPVQEKPNADLQAKAEALIKTSILDLFTITESFGRSIPYRYTLNFTIAAPGDITATPDRLPFEIQRGYSKQKTNFLSGYYDAKAGSVQLFDDKTKTYVAAAEHPYIKARALKPVTPPQPAAPKQQRQEASQQRQESR